MSPRPHRVHTYAAVVLSAACVAAHGQQVTTEWLGAISGAFTDAARWSNGAPKNGTPAGRTYAATIAAADAGPYTITGDLGGAAIDRLTLNSADATLTLRNLAIVERADLLAGTWNAADLAGGYYAVSPGATLGLDGKLNGITLSGSAALVSSVSNVDVLSGLTLDNGTLTVPVTRVLTFANQAGPQAIAGTGTIVLAGEIRYLSPLTIGPGITIQSGPAPGPLGPFGGNMSGQSSGGPAPTLTNFGSLVSRIPGGVLACSGTNYGAILATNSGDMTFVGVNHGTITASDGARLWLTKWSNPDGVATVTDSTIHLRDTRIADLGDLRISNSAVFLEGTIDTTGTALEINAKTGSWTFADATSLSNRLTGGGTIRTTGGTRLVVPRTASAAIVSAYTLDGQIDAAGKLTVGALQFTQGSRIRMLTDDADVAQLNFSRGATYDSGEILIVPADAAHPDPDPFGFIRITSATAATVTFGPGMKVTGDGASASFTVATSGSAFVNEGTVTAAKGGYLEILAPFTNRGAIRAVDGGRIILWRALAAETYASGRLNGGTYFIGANSSIVKGADPEPMPVTVNAADVTFAGANAAFSSLAGLTSNEGKLTVADGGKFATIGGLTNTGTITIGAGGEFRVNGLLAGAGTTDIAGGTLLLGRSTNLPTLLTRLTAASNGGRWNAGGITSALAQSDPSGATAIGYAFMTIVPTQLIRLKYTWAGDCNLDGLVDSADRAAIEAALLLPAGSRTWAQGDFNYDGKLTADDLALFALGASISWGRSISAIPEPSATGVATLGMAALRPRRRRVIVCTVCG